MNSREIFDAIQRNKPDDQQQVLFELAGMVQELSTAVLEIRADLKLLLGRDPLSARSRLHLSNFLELKEGEQL